MVKSPISPFRGITEAVWQNMHAGWRAVASPRDEDQITPSLFLFPPSCSPHHMGYQTPNKFMKSPTASCDRSRQAWCLHSGGSLWCVRSALDLSRAGCVWEGEVWGRQRVCPPKCTACESKVTVLSTSKVRDWSPTYVLAYVRDLVKLYFASWSPSNTMCVCVVPTVTINFTSLKEHSLPMIGDAVSESGGYCLQPLPQHLAALHVCSTGLTSALVPSSETFCSSRHWAT